MRNPKPTTVAKALVGKWLLYLGMLQRLHPDDGRNWVCSCGWFMHDGIDKSRTTPYNPKGNGQCERFNRTWHDLLRPLHLKGKGEKWAEHLSELLLLYNSRPHSSTGFPPFTGCLIRSQNCWLILCWILQPMVAVWRRQVWQSRKSNSQTSKCKEEEGWQ